ncbi:MAG: hypothetical protein WDA24_01695 [Tissierellales bacterium]
MDDFDLIQKAAMTFISQFTSDIYNLSLSENLSINNIQLSCSALKWILESRNAIDIPDSQLDDAIDKTAILLASVYRDKESLPIIAELAFERHRKNCFNHDLVWAFFEAQHINSIYLIANRLQSSEPMDVAFARKLLNFVPGINELQFSNNQQLYSYFNNWFEENSSFLRYTGESYSLKSDPTFYEVVLGAKYLCKPVATDTGQILQRLNTNDKILIEEFNKLNKYAQSLLACYSYEMHYKDKNWWNIWLSYPLPFQFMYANAWIGGIQ